MVKDLQEFLCINFYKHFLPHTAHLLKIHYGVLRLWRANHQVDWTPEQIQVFIGDKSALANAALWAHPVLQASLALMSDVSDVAVGAAVSQRMAGAWQLLAFCSHKLQGNE